MKEWRNERMREWRSERMIGWRREWMNTMELGMVLVNWFAAVASAFWKFAGNQLQYSSNLLHANTPTFFIISDYTSNIRNSHKKDNSFVIFIFILFRTF